MVGSIIYFSFAARRKNFNINENLYQNVLKKRLVIPL